MHASLIKFIAVLMFLGLAGDRSTFAASIAQAPAQCQLGRAVFVNGGDHTIAFPLKVRPGARFLEDAAGNPFFMHGDAAWSLIVQLRRQAVEEYLQDRRRRGFNTILINLLEHRFASDAPNNAYGEPPFLTAGDYARPNEKYFAHADWVIGRAQELGFVIIVAPSWLGHQGGDEGWYGEMLISGPKKLHAYGRYVGQRYQHFKNIIWLHGGDYDPPDKNIVRDIVDGIREFQPNALHSAHAEIRAAVEYWSGEPWLDLNNVYTYEPVIHAARKQYAGTNSMPFFLLESAYENEHNASDWRIRLQTYQAALNGAGGQIFGNNPIWHFDGPGLYFAPTTWREALNSGGARSMTAFCNLYARVEWWRLKPDLDNVLLRHGHGSDREGRAVAALADDRSFALVYLPSARVITLDLSRLAGPVVAATWYDPSSGHSKAVSGSPFRNTVSHPMAFSAPLPRNDGLSDWVLELRSQPEKKIPPIR